MGYQSPPNILSISHNVNNIVSNATIIPAPGVGFRLRIVYLHVFLPRTAAAMSLECGITNGVGGTAIWQFVLNQPNWWNERIPFPEPGVVLSDNTLLNSNGVSTIAGVTAVRIFAYYYIDAVN